jgi:hypothetical protein
MGSPDICRHWWGVRLAQRHVFGALLRPIARRMRQRLLVFFKPNPIAHIDIAMAERATFEMFGLAQERPADLPADDGAARSRLIDIHDRITCTSKKSGPVSRRGPISYGARQESG